MPRAQFKAWPMNTQQKTRKDKTAMKRKNNRKQSATIAEALARLVKNLEQFNNGLEIVCYAKQYRHITIINKEG